MPTPGRRRDGEWLFGMGVATATYPYYRMPGVRRGCGSTPTGGVTGRRAAHEMGMGTATVQTQIAADRLGLPLERGVVRVRRQSRCRRARWPAARRRPPRSVAAVAAAAEALVAELLKLAGNDSPLAGLKADDVVARDGGLAHAKDPSRHESYASILARAKRDEHRGRGSRARCRWSR